MTWVTARLVKRATADGLASILEAVPLGREYQVDTATRRVEEFFNLDHGVLHKKEVISTDGEGFLFTELLDLPKERSDA